MNEGKSGPSAPEEARDWSVWRQDDNGNEALVRGALSESQAHALAAELEAKGHKQLYWVLRGDSRPAP